MEEGGYGMRATSPAPPLRQPPGSPLAHLEHVGRSVRSGVQDEGGAGEQVTACRN